MHEVLNSTERVQRHRERRQRGVKAVVLVEVTDDLVRELVRRDWLVPNGAGDKIKVTTSTLSAVLSQMLDTWAHE